MAEANAIARMLHLINVKKVLREIRKAERIVNYVNCLYNDFSRLEVKLRTSESQVAWISGTKCAVTETRMDIKC